MGVTLCRWPDKQTIPLSVLARNQTKGFGIEISVWPEVVTGREKRVAWIKELTELATGQGQRRSTVDTRAERRGSMRQGPAKKIESRYRLSSCFAEFSLVIHVSVRPYMLSEM